MLHMSPCQSHILSFSYCSTFTATVMYLNEASWNLDFKLRIQLVWPKCRVCDPTWSSPILDHAAGGVDKTSPPLIDSLVRLLILDQDSGSTGFMLMRLKSFVHPPSVHCAEQSIVSRMFTSFTSVLVCRPFPGIDAKKYIEPWMVELFTSAQQYVHLPKQNVYSKQASFFWVQGTKTPLLCGHYPLRQLP